MKRKGPAPGFGPFRTWGLHVAVLLAVAGWSACAAPESIGPGVPAPTDDGSVEADSAIVVEDGDDSPEGLALTGAERAWLAGDYAAAAAVTDSLSRAWTRRPELGERPVRRLARLLLARAEDVQAVDQFLYHPSALDESWREAARAAVERMSVDELDGLNRRISQDERAMGIVRAEFARALALTGEVDRAREAARAIDDAELHDADRRKVEDVLAGRVRPNEPRVRIGLVAPRSGGFEPVGDQLLEGARLAAERYEAETGVPVELVVVDEATAIDSASLDLSAFGDGVFRQPSRVTDEIDPVDDDLEGDAGPRADEAEEIPSAALRANRLGGDPAPGLAAVVGPVLSDGLRAAAAGRTAPGLLLLSPTASEDGSLPPHAYSLWDRARRDSLEATTLGNWLVSAFEPRTIVVVHPDSAPPPLPAAREEPARVAALHPDNESGVRRARILRDLVEPAGFAWVGAEAYHPDSTTHEAQIARLTEADPDFVYTIADRPRQVLQVAPQLHFYGLRGRVTLVNQDWTHPTVLRRLDEPFSDYRVAGVYSERVGNPAWEAFASAWDEAYRRSLPGNAFAALGYDAVGLVLDALPEPALVRPAALARAMTRLDGVQGVTGRFSFDPETGRLVRDARPRMILNSELVEPDPRAILEWSIDTREQELQRLEREAAEEEAEEARRRATP